MELKIPIEVDFDDMKALIDDLGKLQKYKLFEGDEMVLVDVDDVADVLVKHIKAKEAQPKTGRWIVYEVANTEEEQPIAWQCSNCEEVVDCRYNFCPHCGAKMLREGD